MVLIQLFKPFSPQQAAVPAVAAGRLRHHHPRVGSAPDADAGAASGGSSGRTPYRTRTRASARCSLRSGGVGCAAAARAWRRSPCRSGHSSVTWAWPAPPLRFAGAAELVAGPVGFVAVAAAAEPPELGGFAAAAPGGAEPVAVGVGSAAGWFAEPPGRRR